MKTLVDFLFETVCSWAVMLCQVRMAPLDQIVYLKPFASLYEADGSVPECSLLTNYSSQVFSLNQGRLFRHVSLPWFNLAASVLLEKLPRRASDSIVSDSNFTSCSRGVTKSFGELVLPHTPFLSQSFVFGTGGRIRQSPRKIDFSGHELERGF